MSMDIDYPKKGELIFKFNSRWGNICGFVFYLTLFLFFMGALYNTKEITCQTQPSNTEKTCVLTTTYLGFYTQQTPLANLLGARVDRGKKAFYKIMLITSLGDIPLTYMESNFGYNNLSRQAQAIQQFVYQNSNTPITNFVIPKFYSWIDLCLL